MTRKSYMRPRVIGLAVISSAVLAGGLAVDAGAAIGPAPAKTYGGAHVSVYATGAKNVTSMAWGDGAMFTGNSGSGEGLPNGGLDVVKSGKATQIANSPSFVGGLAWHDNALYLSDAYLGKGAPRFQIERWSGFNGTTFAKRQVLYTAPSDFQGFNGIAFGADGRLYVGADLGLNNGNDHGPASTSPYVYDVLSMTADGQDVQVFASGIRQPWQVAFAPGSNSPFISDLGQDGPQSVESKNPPDVVLKVRQGQNYGFPDCNFIKGSPCGHAPKPFKSFAAHSDIMGLAIMGRTLYMGSFTGIGGEGGGALYSVPVSGGKISTLITGLPASTDVLVAHDGDLYIGGTTNKGAGVIYKVTRG